MERQIRQMGLWLFPVLLLGAGLLAPAGAFAAVTASPEFTVAPFATGLRGPTAPALGPPGPFEGRLYVLDRAPGGGTGRLVALDPGGQAAVLAEGFEHPTGLVFSPGGLWGHFAYVLEAPGSGGSALRVLQVSPAGTVISFPIPPGGTRVPAGLALSPGGSWGEALYLSDAGEGQLLRMDPTGAVSLLRKGLSGPRALALAPPGSPFGDGLYAVAGQAVLRLGAEGQISAVVENLVAPGAIAFGSGDTLGTDLYLVEGGLAGGRLLRISPTGGMSPVAQGFGLISGIALAPVGPLGPALFVADYAAGIIYRITPVSP